MLVLRWIATALFVVSVPVLLVLTNVRIATTEQRTYDYSFSQYDVDAVTGVDRRQLDAAALTIIDYFRTGEAEDLLDVRVFVGDREESLFNQREILHMRDVKDLVQLAFRVQEVTFIYVLCYVTFVFLWARERTLRALAAQAVAAGVVTVALLGALAIGVTTGFEDLFEQFHLLSFNNDLWLLNPATDRLLQMFPEGFWFDVTLGVGLLTMIEGGLLALVGVAGLLWPAPRVAVGSRPRSPQASGFTDAARP